MIKHRCFFNCNFKKIIFFFIWGMWLTIFAVSLELSPVYANGPIPFSENFDTFSGAGFDPNPSTGQLDSDIWVVIGMSDGDGTFGGTHTASDFARGPSNGVVGTGGVYAFDIGSGNNILGIQSGGNDFTPGDIILRLQNNTSSTITQLDVSYDIWYLNDQPRANSLNFSHSPDDLTYTSVAALDFTTPEPADALGWQSAPRSTTLTGLNIANGDYFYLKWTGDDVSGSGSRDECGLDNVQVTVPAGDSPPTVSSTTPIGGATGVAVDTNLTLQFSEDVTVTDPWFTLNCSISGGRTATVSGGPQTYTLNPDTDFSNSETCTVTVLAAQVTDQDGTPDTMPADYTFTFTTVAPPAAWVINEIHADPHATGGDANGDGIVSSSQDEFVEIINNTGTLADISGWTLSDGVGVKHTFPAGTTLPNQCAIVIFGGGTPTGSFGDALVQTAGSLGLNNPGDTVTLAGGGGAPLAAYTYGNEGSDDQSLTRSPDLTGPDPLVKHAVAPGSGGALFSPGTTVDGSKFSGCSQPRVIGNTPTDGATSVAINTPITIQFSEAVTTTASSFSLDCTGPVTLDVSPPPPGSSDTFTLTPTANMPNSATCAITVAATEITDQDDTPETMAANHTFTFTTAAPILPVLISEFLYDGLTPSSEGDEFVELCNPNGTTVDLTGYKVGDEAISGGGESMYQIPTGTQLAPDACLVIAKNAADFQTRFGFAPTFEAGALTKYTAWGSGSWSLSNTGDELIVLGPGDQILDSVAYRNGDYATLGLEADATAPEPHSLQRVWPTDTNSMPYDFVRAEPTPGRLTLPPPPVSLPPAILPGGMNAYWGHLHAHTTYSDGAGPPYYALAVARLAGLHFYGITDHGWWINSPDWWAKTLTQTISATVPGQFVALRGVEWSHDIAGHINIFNSDTLLQRTNPLYDELSDVYTWLAANPNAIAQFNHPDPGYGGTFSDFAFHPAAAQMMFMQEIGNNAQQQYTTYEASFVQSNMAGWRTAPTNNGDTHSAQWGFDTPARTGLVAPALTEADLLAAMRARRVFATEDSNLALAMRLNGAWMGSVLTATGSMSLTIDVVDPDSEPVSLYVYDSNLLLETLSASSLTAQSTVGVDVLPGHFYWVKAVQADGDAAYTAPVWIEGQAPADTLVINEILPAPNGIDWDGDGTGNGDDEWIELYNPLDRPVGLGGWRLRDAAGVTYNIPLGLAIPAGGYAVLYKAQTGIGLNNSGDTVTLIHPDSTIIDTVTYDHSPGGDESWCRLPDGGSTWSDDCLPSPNNTNSERPPNGPLHVNIAEAKTLAYNAWVVVKGSVTAPPGVFGNRTMYIQDDTAGIMIYLPKDHRLALQPGDSVEVEGNLRTYHHEFEIVVADRQDVYHTGHGPPPPPLPIATTSLLEPYEGLLVQLQGQAVGFKGRSTLWVDDGTGWAKVVIRGSTGIKKPFIEYGTPVTVVGVVSQYSAGDDPSRDDYRLLPRYQFDLQLPAPESPPQLSSGSPRFLPETGY